MDGTLLRIDTLPEALFAAAFANWRVLPQVPGWLSQGKAQLKQELAQRWQFDPAGLPYNRPLLEWLRAQHEAGRKLVLCTASHALVAQRVADHLGLFDAVIATEGGLNLRGDAKAEALGRRFGKGGFVYVGNDATDFAVWDQAAAAVLVNTSGTVRHEARARYAIEAEFDDGVIDPLKLARASLRAMRPYQWVKNALCLVPVIASADFSPAAWLGTLLITLAFCLTASGIYLINDISDLAADRAHPRKRHRPFASGEVPVAVGLLLCPILLLAGVVMGWASGALLALGAYVIASLAYNIWLKEQPLIDVFVLAGLYTVRLFGGGEASGHPVSLWLLGFSSFLFLSLAFIKRVSELLRISATPARAAMRRGYLTDDTAMLQMFGCASTFTSAIVLALYVQSDAVERVYVNPAMLWAAVPLLLFWQCRLWLSTARGYMHDDPIVYAARDWVSWAVFAVLALVVIAAWAPL
jgi:4-hydroxybenzoate polyprenyltransferase